VDIILTSKNNSGISKAQIKADLIKSLEPYHGKLKKVLLIPPDYTRMHSGAGDITNIYYHALKENCKVDILPALGTHEPMTKEECTLFFGADVPFECVIVHNWREDIVKIGEVPKDYVSKVSESLFEEKIDVEVNKLIVDQSYDLIISIGQVVPHEVVGMANYSKNVFVGCGGSAMINSSHMLGAVYGMEKVMGKDNSPVRKIFDYAQEKFLSDTPLLYVLTVTTKPEGKDVAIKGLYIGKGRSVFEHAVDLSQELNLNYVDKPFKKVVVYLDPLEFKSTWLGNKAIYRTRMAIDDGGELIIIGPGISKFGEDSLNDEQIRKYGYIGREKVLKLWNENEDLKSNMAVAAHLIHGSHEDRFTIVYAPGKLTKDQIQHAGYQYMDIDVASKTYDITKLKDGYNTLDSGEQIYYISNPALGLWADKTRI